MKLRVNKDKCEVIENEIWNVGDYHVKTVQVELSDDFNGLVNKVRYFVDDDCYDMVIDNNVAQIPYEATKSEGIVKIGVYGFDVDTNVLVQSTSPIIKYITRGTYTGEATNTEPLTPTDKQQMEMQIQENKESIDYLEANKQDKLISGQNIKTINNETILGEGNIDISATLETDPVFTHSPAYNITEQDITDWNNKSDFSGDYNDLTNKPTIPDVSDFITKDVNDLTYYTTTANLSNVALSGSYNDLINTPDLSIYATTTQLGNETTARENADTNLQGQIDAITSASDVKDIVGTYAELENYDTTTLGNDDIIKVLQDSTHNNAMTYYRWVIASGFGEWEYIGQEGPYYTKSETDTLLNAKQNEIDTTHKLSSDLVDDTNNTNLFVTSTEKTTWDNKQDALTAGANITISSGTISATDTTYSDATTSASGLMSSTDKTKLVGIATGANVNVQANWNETDTSSDSYIQNKPTIPTDTSDLTNGAGYTTNIGTITSVKMNGSTVSSSGEADLGTVITSHQDISGKENTSNKVTSISSSSTDTQYPSAKCVYDIIGDVESLLSEV